MRLLSGLLAVSLSFSLAACSDENPATPLEDVDISASSRAVTAIASGGYKYTIPEAQFGLPSDIFIQIDFTAERHADGSVSGRWNYDQDVPFLDFEFEFQGTITCMTTRGDRAWVGGIIEKSNDPDPDFGVGRYAWFQVWDLGEGANTPADSSSLVGFGDEQENEEFCDDQGEGSFKWAPEQGNIQVMVR